jgi:predicted O-methyltransferase YrrM
MPRRNKEKPLVPPPGTIGILTKFNQYFDSYYTRKGLEDNGSKSKFTTPVNGFLVPSSMLQVLEVIASTLSSFQECALDIGSGAGRSTFALATIFRFVVGVEIDENRYEIAKKTLDDASLKDDKDVSSILKKVHFEYTDVNKSEIAKQHYKLIYSFSAG